MNRDARKFFFVRRLGLPFLAGLAFAGGASVLSGCVAGAPYEMGTREESDSSLSVWARNNTLVAHSHAGKERPGDGVVSLSPRVRLDPKGEKQYRLELEHRYTDAGRAFGDVVDLEFLFRGKEPRVHAAEHAGTTSREVKSMRGGVLALGLLTAAGELAVSEERAKCQLQSVYQCQEPASYPTEDELYRTYTEHVETSTFAVTREQLVELARVKPDQVKVTGLLRSETFSKDRIPFTFRNNIRMFLGTLQTVESSREWRWRVARAKAMAGEETGERLASVDSVPHEKNPPLR